MKYFKSLLFTACALFALAACNTDDLKDDINNLKDRVESLEAQVGLLNDNMTAIKVLLEGGKTITELTNNNGTYTLKLSDGQTISLTQGSKGEIKVPTITVNAEGQWVVEGSVLLQNGKPVQAVGTPGENGATPKFRINSNGNYWEVTYDDGTKWETVLDTNGKPVVAVGDGTGSVNDQFFEDVKVVGDSFMIKLKDAADYISIPIVKDVLCQIIEPAEGLKDGFWEIGYGKNATTTVKVKGDNIITTAPTGWTVTVSEPDATTNEATLTITAPATPATKAISRATADNSYDVTVQVNKGASWAVAKIQVKAIDVIDSYYDFYMAGGTIMVNDIEVNKAKFGEDEAFVKRIDSDQEIKTAGIYFIKEGVTASYAGTLGITDLILIGDKTGVMSTVNVNTQITINQSPSTAAGGNFLCKNIKLIGVVANQLFTVNTDILSNAAFDGCEIKPSAGKHILYLSTSTRSITNFSMANCTFISEATNQKYIMSFGSSTSQAYQKVTFKNNVFYCPTGKVNQFALFTGASTGLQELTLENNTFINMETATSGMVYTKNLSTISVKNNLFWSNTAGANDCIIIRPVTTSPTGTICADNIVYKTMTFNWKMFWPGTSLFTGAEDLKVITDNPFEGGTFDLENGKFVPNATYAGYGASIN